MHTKCLVRPSPTCDFRVKNEFGYMWGLPLLVPTCPKKLFAEGPRKKYVDIVTDTLHASSSDLITWNTLIMLRLKWYDHIPRAWLEITTFSMEEWQARDQKRPFLPDNKRGYARVTPVALSIHSVFDQALFTVDQYPLSGLGMCESHQVSSPDICGQIGLTRLSNPCVWTRLCKR